MTEAAENIIDEITHEKKTRLSIRFRGLAGKLSAPVLQFMADILALIISFAIQYYIRFESGLVHSSIEFELTAFAMTASFLSIYWIILFFFSGLYKNWYIRSPFDEFFTVVRVAFFGCFVLVFFIFSESGQSPRLLFLIYFLVFTVSVSAGRFVARRLQKKLRAVGIISIPALIVGTADKAREFYIKTKRAKPWGYNVIGILLTSQKEMEYWKEEYKEDDSDIPLLGHSDMLSEILNYIKIREVIISTKEPEHSLILEIVAKCADKNVGVQIDPDIYDIFMGQTRTQNIYGIPLIEISTQLLKPWQEVLKRIWSTLSVLYTPYAKATYHSKKILHQSQPLNFLKYGRLLKVSLSGRLAIPI